MPEHHAAFMADGYCLPDVQLDCDEIDGLTEACNALLQETVDDGGRDRHRIGLGDNRRFLCHRHADFPRVEAFVLGAKMATLSRELLGAPTYLFNEQFVVKGPRTGAGFAWHQDSGYVGHDHKPYLTVWIALDDATEKNGCIRVLPRNLAREAHIEEHVWQEGTREYNAYTGDNPGIALPRMAGQMLAFSSLTLHSSGPNTTAHSRRAYICQYSIEPVADPRTGALKRFARPLPQPG